jgi:hypothetical protein
VAHGFDQPVGRHVRAGQRAGLQEDVQRLLDFGGVLLQSAVKIGHGGALPETGKNH